MYLAGVCQLEAPLRISIVSRTTLHDRDMRNAVWAAILLILRLSPRLVI